MALLVQVSELRFVTPEGKAVLENVNLRVEQGEFVMLVGPPSSGKSLIFKLLCRERDPQRGQILVDDRNITRLSPDRLPHLRRRLGIVPQHGKPLQRTVLDALLFKLGGLGFEPDHAQEKAQEILETLGLQSVSDEMIAALSPPQQKLFALALAACHDPVLLLIDEPFDGLEYQEAQTVLEGMKRLHQRKRLAVLAATREVPWALRSGARIVYLWAGQTFAEAPPATESVSQAEESE